MCDVIRLTRDAITETNSYVACEKFKVHKSTTVVSSKKEKRKKIP